MITVTIHRKTLVRHNACKEGLALYDAIAALQADTDTRKGRRIRIANWTPLHTVWAACAGFAQWLESKGIIPRANLHGANLDGANLHGANLTRADLAGANLYGANLYGANLDGANLHGANLTRADLAGANLYGADLDGANLHGATLDGANLDGANLGGAYRGVRSLPLLGWRTLATGYLERDPPGGSQRISASYNVSTGARSARPERTRP